MAYSMSPGTKSKRSEQLGRHGAAWGAVLLGVALAAGASGCSREELNQHGIEVKDGKVKRVFKF